MAISIDGSNNTIAGLANGGLPDGCILDADINGMAASKLTGAIPASTHDVLQTQIYSLSQDFTTTNQGWTEVTNLAVTITPSSNSNKVLLVGALNLESWGDQDRRMTAAVFHTSITDSNRIVRANEGVYRSGSSSSYSYGQFTFWYIHTPNTSSAITYKVGIASPDGTNLKVGSDGGNAINLQTYIYAQEIKG
tara:strand:- start:1406 stop:1984 length:579 start_codon:yes stop_codon:yes gene_type:complete